MSWRGMFCRRPRGCNLFREMLQSLTRIPGWDLIPQNSRVRTKPCVASGHVSERWLWPCRSHCKRSVCSRTRASVSTRIAAAAAAASASLCACKRDARTICFTWLTIWLRICKAACRAVSLGPCSCVPNWPPRSWLGPTKLAIGRLQIAGLLLVCVYISQSASLAVQTVPGNADCWNVDLSQHALATTFLVMPLVTLLSATRRTILANCRSSADPSIAAAIKRHPAILAFMPFFLNCDFRTTDGALFLGWLVWQAAGRSLTVPATIS